LYSFLKGLSSVSGDFMQISSDLCDFSSVFFLFWAKFGLSHQIKAEGAGNSVPCWGLGQSPNIPNCAVKQAGVWERSVSDSCKAFSIRFHASL